MMDEVLAKHLMSRPVRRLTPRATIRDAAEFMLRFGISGAPVVGPKGELVGVLSMTDIGRHVQNRLLELPVMDPARERARETGEGIPLNDGFHYEGFEDERVEDFMTPGVVTVFEEATLRQVVRSMVSQKIHRVFVLSDEGELRGVITTMDILKWMERRRATRKKQPV